MVTLLVLLDQLIELIILDMGHDLRIRVILHDLEYLNLMRLQGPAIAIYQIPEEIQQFRLVVTVLRLALNILTYFSDEFKHCRLIIQHSLVIVIHLLEEIYAAYVLADMMYQPRDMPLHEGLDLVEVLNQRNDEVVTEME